MGRESKIEYSEELAQMICARIATGRSLVSVCQDPDMPSQPVITRWRKEIEEFNTMYNEALRYRADFHVDEMFRIAAEEEDVARAKLMVDVRKWATARMHPRAWGDKQQHQVSGENGGPLIVRWGGGSDDAE